MCRIFQLASFFSEEAKALIEEDKVIDFRFDHVF